MDINIKRLTDTATIPTKAHDSDACFDIYADCPDSICGDFVTDDELNLRYIFGLKGIKIEPGESVTINTGISTEIPEGYFAAVFCRSGMGIKRHLRLSNSVGIIDSHYRGEWVVCLHNDGRDSQIIHHGDRIAQFAILPVLDFNLNEVDELSNTDRSTGGFGSTGA